ncbi:MAG TPA: DUF58 domain-containing protein [Actinomycetota bacterium]|nr:DUF58 domain-containing protein [Actinomycetota bacterium]
MPTARGWSIVGAAVALGLTGRALGAPEIERLGVALLALVVIAIVVVRRGRHELEIERSITPERSQAGGDVTVTLDIKNKGRSTAPLMLLEDRLPRGVHGTARFILHGIEAGGMRSATYQIAPGRRGRFEVGPSTIRFMDPFGLARVRATTAGLTSFLVRPQLEPLTMLTERGQRRAATASVLRQPIGAIGEDFYTLREYVEGDDLRRIHWPSTAKRGRFIIRQEETTWNTTATILLDDDAADHSTDPGSSSFERAIEAAAAFIDLYHQTGYSWRLLTAVAAGSKSARGPEHWGRCMDLLATVEPSRSSDDPMLTRIAEAGSTMAQSTLVVIVGTLTPDVSSALGACTRRFREVIVVSFPAHRYGDRVTRARWAGEKDLLAAQQMLVRAGARVVTLGPEDRLSAALTPARMIGGETPWERKPELA